MDGLKEPKKVEDGDQEAKGDGKGKNVNTDRLRPRGVKRGADDDDDDVRTKKTRGGREEDGLEELARLRSLVPSLVGRGGRLSHVAVIQETIQYIDCLHRRILERASSSSSSQASLAGGLTLEQVSRLRQSVGKPRGYRGEWSP